MIADGAGLCKHTVYVLNFWHTEQEQCYLHNMRNEDGKDQSLSSFIIEEILHGISCL